MATTMRAARVIDISESSLLPPDSWWTAIKAPPHNIEAIIISCWDSGPNPYYHGCALMADRAGLPRAAYVWPPSQWHEALTFTGLDWRLHFFVLDVEKPDGVAADFCKVSHAHVQGVHDMGFKPWIYSSASEWPLVMGNDQGWPAEAKAWKAGYRSVPGWPDLAPDFPVQNLWGGWTEAHGWQIQGTTDLLGVPVDMSLFSADAFGLEELDMGTADDIRAEMATGFQSLEAVMKDLKTQLDKQEQELVYLAALLKGHAEQGLAATHPQTRP